MHQKFVILGLVLLLAGTAMLGWALVERRKQQQEANENIEQYNELLQLPSEEPTQLPLGLDGNGEPRTEAQLQQERQEELQADLEKLAAGETDVYAFEEALYGNDRQNDLKKRRELSEFAITGSIVCISMGGTILVWYLLLWCARFFMRDLSGLMQFLSDVLRRRRKTMDDEEEPWQEQQTNQQQSQQPDSPEEALPARSESRPDNIDLKRVKERLGTYSDDDAKEIAVLLSDEKSEDSLAKIEDSLKVQTEKLEKQTAQSVQQAIKEHSKPLDTTLKDLAQQVSAIREYATCQQERMEKLQDGYDWNIVKTFCLRIIRCIDNLDNRINQHSSDGTKAEHLEEIKDELIFALESSGIEQFVPEINSDYRGQEKYAEAVKDKQCCDDQEQKGRIAEVIRPGYQYFINEENVKIVRTAQVKLFG